MLSPYGVNSSDENLKARLVLPTEMSPNNISLRDRSCSYGVSGLLLEESMDAALDSIL